MSAFHIQAAAGAVGAAPGTVAVMVHLMMVVQGDVVAGAMMHPMEVGQGVPAVAPLI